MKKINLSRSLILLLVSASVSSLYASQTSENYTEKLRNVSESMITTDTSDSEDVQSGHKVHKDDYMDTVIYNDVLINVSPQTQTLATSTIGLSSNVNEYMAKAELSEKARVAEKVEKEKEIFYHVGGYCTFINEIDILATSEFANLDCNLDFGNNQYRSAKVFIGLYPDYKREKLLALPVYATMGKGNRLKFNGVVLKGDRTSLNVATHTDNRRIRKLTAKSLLASSDAIYNVATRYLYEYEASQRVQEVTYVTTEGSNGFTNTVPVVTNNTEKPNPNLYWTMAGVDLVGKLVDMFGEDYLSQLTPLFSVKGNSQVYIEGVVSKDDKGVYGAFGKINTETVKEINQNNDKYEQEKTDFIKQYEQESQRDNFKNTVSQSISGVTVR